MIPYVTHKQIAKLDKLMISYFKVPVVMMMENAGYRMAEFVRSEFSSSKNVLICVGKGNNGGDGISACRHLLNFGFKPKLFLINFNLKKEPLMHLKIAKKLKIPIITSLKELEKEIKKCDLIYDCLIGYNLKGEPYGKFKDVISILNSSGKKVIACDTPSGVDTDKGVICSTYVRASHILFLSLPKLGCRKLNAKKYVADIGVPKALYPMIKVKAKDYFEKKSILKL